MMRDMKIPGPCISKQALKQTKEWDLPGVKNWYFSNRGRLRVEFESSLATTSAPSDQRFMSICSGSANSGSYGLNSFGSENMTTV